MRAGVPNMRIRLGLAAIRPGLRYRAGVSEMIADTDKIDDAVLALLYLTLHDNDRAWKGFEWETLGRLHGKGLIHSPVGKVRSVVFTAEGLRRSKELFETMFAKQLA
jgi:hypothetical protein